MSAHGTLKAQQAPGRGVDADGSVTLPLQRLPFSNLASAAAEHAFKHRIDDGPVTTDAEVSRAHYGRFNDALAADMLAKYPVHVSEDTLGGVRVHRVVSQLASPADLERGILINLHGGAFMWGSGSGALVEAIPIAAATNLLVVTVDYRMAPEHVFPAASEDACAVYEAILNDFPAESIGLYGLSAGALLSAQLIAWLQKRGLQRPAAVAMLGGAGADIGGDSASLGASMTGSLPESGLASLFSLPYLTGADRQDPLALPDCADDVLAKFPPSLLITASRDFAASSVSSFHRRLVANGVDARLFVFDGLWHAFHIFSELPEAQETYRIMADFFMRTLRLKA
ncbi:MAG: alpha/beta hydrolase fold domain-containing protein [Hyphomonadaceae bacterium]|nr:alpha/beta hydrolase fold domain-containing protein [Hyphomonadaceae bacterium]